MKNIFILFFIFVNSFCFGQNIGYAKSSICLEDGYFAGIWYEPTGLVWYAPLNNDDTNQLDAYGLTIYLHTSNYYISINHGYKVAFEYLDGTKEICDVIYVDTDFTCHLNLGHIHKRYTRILRIAPDFENLTTKRLNRIIFQLINNNKYIIEVMPRRSMKLCKEFKKCMNQAKESYDDKVQTEIYFNTPNNITNEIFTDY